MTNQISKVSKVLAFIFLGINNIFSQEALELREYFPPSPTAQEFIKYGEYPVGMYTGVPSISIPLHNISVKDIEIPISLSYHSAGIQVDQIASEVGLGWSMNVGGLISKIPHGIPDDVQNGFLKYDVPEVNEIGSDYNFLDDVVLGERDTESDMYHYTFAGYSGKFFFDREGETRLVEETPIRIKYFEGVPSKFVITTENGVVYEFNETEQTQTITLGGSNEQSYTSSWHLSKITSVNQNDYVSFIYESVTPFSTYQYNYRETTAVGYYPTNTYPSDHEFGHLSSISQTTHTPKRLKEVVFPNGKIVFARQSGRLDTSKERLDNMAVLSYNGVQYDTIKSFEFVHDYYHSDINISAPINNPNPTDVRRYRLKLTELREYNKNETEAKTHFFGYDENMLPPVNSNGKDFWGYYNGQNSNTTLIPKQDFKINSNDVGAADRNPYPEYMGNGILKRITYPTGGYTEFTFEPNEYVTTEGEIVNAVKDVMAAGLDNVIGNPPFLQDSIIFTPNYSGYATLHIEASNRTSTTGTYPTVILEQLGTYNHTLINHSITPGQYPNMYQNPPSSSEIEITFDPMFLDSGVSYKLKVIVEGSSTSTEFDGAAYIIADITYKHKDTTNMTPVTKVAGGLRIQQISSYNKPNELAFSKKYEYASGKLITPEVFLREQYLVQEVIYMSGGGDGCPSQSGFQRRFLSGGTVQTLTLNGGSAVVYNSVNEYTVDDSNNNIGRTNYTFDIESDMVLPVPIAYFNGIILIKKDWMGGQNRFTTMYPNGSTNFVKREERKYINKKYNEAQSYKMYKVLPFAKMEGSSTSCWRDLPNTGIYKYSIVEYPIHSGIKLLSSTESTTRDENGSELTSMTSIFYDNDTHLQPTKTEEITSDGNTVVKEIHYPDDIENTTSLGLPHISVSQKGIIDKLKGGQLHQVAIPIQTVTTVKNNGGATLSKTTQRTHYSDFGGDLILADTIKSSKGVDSETLGELENRIVFEQYDGHGNPLQVTRADGSPIYYIWGYNGQYPIAKIENATLSEVVSALGGGTLSDYDEGDMEGINGLRNALSKAMITTYTYDPLIGVTSITDPRGYTSYYEYDDFNRLETVKDEEGNLLTDYQYHYKN
ncbi:MULTISPECIES: RHS repeat domain-containing protein [Flavobacteriaceae]|uniref:RHS repeat domain-containing protein n=1 Tax=Flavobacteriaceae TaxID=49546 RepID=UPI00234B1D8A|nr:RHS repeat domain-containing protein [Muricauda sp. SP22]MDC6364024.1 RHS repeat protein [Muricauda sp. SP22]